MKAKFPYLAKADLDQEQRQFWEMLTLGERGFYTGGADAVRLPDLYNAWLYFVPLGRMATSLGERIRTADALDGKLRELIVLTTSARLGAFVEFDFHIPFALDQGLDREVVDCLRENRTPDLADPLLEAVHLGNLQLLDGARMDPGVRERIIGAIGYGGMMQMVATVVLYVATAYTVNVAGVELAEDFSADENALKDYYAGIRRG